MTVLEVIALHDAIASVCPIHGLIPDGYVMRPDYRAEATAEQRSLAEEIVRTGVYPLDHVRAKRIEELRREASAAILAAAPEHKQRNAALGLYDAGETQRIKDAVSAGRAAFAAAEAAVNAAQTIADVEAVTHGS